MKTLSGSSSFLVLLFSAVAAGAGELPLASGLYAPDLTVPALEQPADRWGYASGATPAQRLVWLGEGKAQLLGLTAITAKERAAEDKARTAKLGLWAAECCKLLTASETVPADRFRIVQGKVLAVTVRREIVFVNFGADWRTDFTLMLKPGLAKRLKAESWVGQVVTARGWVESYYGPAIKITAASQMQLPQAVKSRTTKR